MPEAMKQIRNELGNNAVILNTRVIHTSGFLGFFKKRRFEVVAALDQQQMEPKPVATSTQKWKEPSFVREELDLERKEDQQLKEEWRKELSELKQLLKNSQTDYQREGVPLPLPIQQLQQALIKQDLDHAIIDEIIKRSIESWYKTEGGSSFNQIKLQARDYLIKQINHLPFGGVTFSKKYINIVGPTGVGKTTTLAKIAAASLLTYKKKVAFITTDTYRIAAIDQLKTYANILKVPIEVCYSLDDFHKAIKQFESCDLIFIDTAGRNFRNSKYVEDLREIIDFQLEMETFLVLALTSKQSDMEEIIKQFSLISIDKIIFTKADETSTFGSMYNILSHEQKGAAYITNGQDVPDDLFIATPKYIVDLIVGVE
jgi:flagellar biosynthesis protein FlhF